MTGAERNDRYFDVGGEDQRTPAQRDRDRILYSEEFRRLSGVTQVARADESYLYHDRLSHSLKVAQVGRRLAEDLISKSPHKAIGNYLDPDVVETAALAHDLGHPPWGHVVEKKLDELIRDRGVKDGFEGNPQSFRIVTQTGTQSSKYPGLNLTRASLNAMLKYPWGRDEDRNFDKWGYYESEEPFFEFARELSHHNERSLEADIMDWADDLTYGIHDVTDFYKSGLIPLDRLLVGTQERDEFVEALYNNTDISPDDIDPHQFFEWLASYFASNELKTPYRRTDPEKSALKEFSSTLVNRYLGIGRSDVKISRQSGDLVLSVAEDLKNEIEVLKYLTIYYVIEDERLMAQQRGQQEIVKTIFEIMMENADTPGRFANIIPSPYRERLDGIDDGASERHKIRVVADFISILTEKQATELYERFTGHSPGVLQDKIF